METLIYCGNPSLTCQLGAVKMQGCNWYPHKQALQLEKSWQLEYVAGSVGAVIEANISIGSVSYMRVVAVACGVYELVVL